MRGVSMFARLFGTAPALEPRQALSEAIHAFGGSPRVEIALRYFDDPKSFEEDVLEAGREPGWFSDEREPSEAELASGIFNFLLSHNDYIAHMDWAAGPDEIVSSLNQMFLANALPSLDETEQARFHVACEGQKRGGDFEACRSLMEEAARQRGGLMEYFIYGDDAHHPVFVSPEWSRRWSSARFGKGFPVVPLA